MTKWTADEARQRIEAAKVGKEGILWDYDLVQGFKDTENLLAEREVLVLHIQDFLNFTPGWAESKLFKALPEYLRKEIEDGT